MGIGVFPENEPESLKMLGMHGTRYANYAIQNCDLIIAIGARFDDRITGKISEFSPNSTVVHIDIDPTSISKNIYAHVPVVGDVKDVLKKLNKIVEKPKITEWKKQIVKWKKEYPLTYRKNSKKILPQEVIAAINKIMRKDDIIVTDVGQHQMWATHFIDYKKPRTFLSSGGLGTMGFGLPAALGAKLGKEKSVVFAICGDGGFQMNIQELATAAINKIPVISIVLNNGYLGMVRQWQELFYDKRYAMTCLDRKADCPTICNEPTAKCPTYIPDFIKLAEGYSCYGKRITKHQDVEPALDEALKIATEKNQPVVLEFITEPEENVYPMVPAGARLDDMLDELV
jgi:acetolactate synthase-1/2/3 large subunit